MKTITFQILILISAFLFSECTPSAYTSSSVFEGDDLYETLDSEALIRQQKAEQDSRRAALDAYVAKTLAHSDQEQLSATGNPYQSILADDYQTAYERRLHGLRSSSYRQPISYATVTSNRSFTYATAYDPAQYNIIISGDQVWVEPKYITSMFGTWGGSPYGAGISWGFSFGYNPWYSTWYNPWWQPHYGYGYWGNPWWGWHDPWYPHGYYHPWWGYGWGGYGWGCGYYRPHNYRYDGYNGHRPSSGYRGHRAYNRGGTYYRGGSNHRGGGYNRGGSYNRGSYNRGNDNGYNRNTHNRGSYNNRESYNNRGSYNNTTPSRPTYTPNPSYNTGSYRSGSSQNSYNRGR